MKFSAALVVAAMGAAPAAALPTDITSDTDLPPRTFGNLSGLQSKYARGIMAQAKREHLGSQGCRAGIATALVEVSRRPAAGEPSPRRLVLTLNLSLPV